MEDATISKELAYEKWVRSMSDECSIQAQCDPDDAFYAGWDARVQSEDSPIPAPMWPGQYTGTEKGFELLTRDPDGKTRLVGYIFAEPDLVIIGRALLGAEAAQ